jgi:hypothetical protein
MGEPSIMRQLEIALASSGGNERLFRVHCRPIVAKIESDAKVIAALREALEIIAGRRQCLDNLMSNVAIAEAALGTIEQIAGETK